MFSFYFFYYQRIRNKYVKYVLCIKFHVWDIIVTHTPKNVIECKLTVISQVSPARHFRQFFKTAKLTYYEISYFAKR